MAKTKAGQLPDFGLAIDRLRQLAACSGDHLLLGDGAPSPDHKLLELCAEIAEARKAYEARKQERRDGFVPKYARTPAQEAECQAREAKEDQGRRLYGGKLRAAGKIKATTAAGIYAKAVAVRSSKTGAAKLAMSLAEDLVNNPTLRASLWAADAAPGGA